MQALVALSALLAVSAAQVLPYSAYHGYPYSGYYGYPYGYAGAYPGYVAPTVYAAAPAAVSSQYHAQDELGQFNYGYAGPLSSKTETKRFDGATVGSYNYIDANGVVQTVSYVADPVNGFRVSATNLPVAPVADLKAPEFNLEAPVFDGVAPEPVQDTPEVAAAKAEFRKAYAEAAAAAEAAPDTDATEEEADAPAERRRRSAILYHAAPLAKTTFKTATLDKVEADTPADTTLLEVKEKEHEAYVPAPVVYHAAPAVTYHAAAVPVVKPVAVTVKHVAAPVAYHVAPAVKTVVVDAPKIKTVELKAAPLPLTYASPYHVPLVYTFKSEDAEAEEKSE